MARFKQTNKSSYPASKKTESCDEEENTSSEENTSNTVTTVTPNRNESRLQEPIVTSAINSINLCHSPDNNETPDVQIEYYDIFEHPECLFDTSYSSNWVQARRQSLLDIDTSTVEDTELITRLCADLSKPLKFNSLISHNCNNKTLIPLLRKRKWINDEVINSMMMIFNYKLSVHNYKHKVYFLQTSLYKYLSDENSNKLTSTGSPVKYPPGSRGFSSFDKIIVPINHNNEHWSICIIEPNTKIVYHIDSIKDADGDKIVYKHIKKYIRYENAKGIEHMPDLVQVLMRKWRVRFPTYMREDDVPQQIVEGGDCGLFTILFAEAFGFQLGYKNITQHNIDSTHFRMKICKLLLCFKQDIPIVIHSEDNIIDNSIPRVSLYNELLMNIFFNLTIILIFINFISYYQGISW